MAGIRAEKGGLHVGQRRNRTKGEILEQRTSQGHIHDLHAAADGQDGFLGFQRLGHQVQVEAVHGQIGAAPGGQRFLSEQQGRDIPAAAEEETVTEFQISVGGDLTWQQGQQERKTAGIRDGVEIGLSDELLFSILLADRKTDDWAHKGSPFQIKYRGCILIL